jgi:hypothetical protein
MTQEQTNLYNWSADSLLQIELANPDDFLKIKETLTRIGVASKKDNTLFQTCHILHKRGKYYCVMFKELFQLDGRTSDISHEDIARRNTIAALLEQWGLCKVLPSDVEEYKMTRVAVATIKIVSFKEKREWTLLSKYSMRSERKPR